MPSRTLNIRYDMAMEEWQKLDKLYPLMPGWLGYVEEACPCWAFQPRSTEPVLHISASVEPSGLLLACSQDHPGFEEWTALLMQKASVALEFQVQDAES